MSIQQDFNQVWQPFADKLLSQLAEETARGQLSEVEVLQQFYVYSLRMWEDPGQVQGGFLRKWQRTSPDFVDRFLNQLRGFHFANPAQSTRISPMPYVGGTLAATAAGCTVGNLLPATNFLKATIGTVPAMAVSGAVFAMLGGGIIKALYENKVEAECKLLQEHYALQITQLHDRLEDFCRHFDTITR